MIQLKTKSEINFRPEFDPLEMDSPISEKKYLMVVDIVSHVVRMRF